MSNPVIMHVNFCEVGPATFGRSVEAVCRKAVDFGYDGIEFRAEIPRDFKVSVDEYVDMVAAGKKSTGLENIIFGVVITGISSEDKDVRKKAIDDAIHFFQIANDKCGSVICNSFADKIVSSDWRAAPANFNYHGSAVATQTQWDLTVDGYQQIGVELEKLGMKVGLETHMNYIHDVPKASMKLVDLIGSPTIGLNMDYGNMIHFINMPTPVETVKMLGDRIVYMHIKNSVGISDELRVLCPLGEGDINHRIYMQAVKEIGYTGPIAIESPRQGDRDWYAREDLAYFKDVAKEVWG